MPTVDPGQVLALDKDTDNSNLPLQQQQQSSSLAAAPAPVGQLVRPEQDAQESFTITTLDAQSALGHQGPQGGQAAFPLAINDGNMNSITTVSAASRPINGIHDHIQPATPTPTSFIPAHSLHSVLSDRAVLEPESEPYPSFQSFFSLPSSSAERGMSFEQMLMANSVVASGAIGSHLGAFEDSPTLEPTYHTAHTSTRTGDNSNSNSKFLGSATHPLASDTSKRSETIVVDGSNNPISSSTPAHVGSPNSDPSSINTILSVAEYIPGTSREEMEEECLDYRLKGRSRVSRGYSADFSTSQWSVAAGGNHASTSQDHPRADGHHTESGQQSPSRLSSQSIRTPPIVRTKAAQAAEMLPLSEFLAEDPKDASPLNSSSGGRYLTGSHPGYLQYSPPSTPPPPTLTISTQTGRIPITSASGQFSGFQQYTPPHKESRLDGHSRISNVERPVPIGSIHYNETQLPNADSGVLGTENDHGEDDFLHQGKPVRNYKVFPGRNRFFCGGRIMTSRDFPAFFVAILLLIIPTGLFHGFTSPFLWHRVSPAAPIVQAYLFIVAFSSMLKTSWTDPGVIPRGIDGDPPLDPPRELDVTSASFYPPQSLPRLKEVQVGMYTVRLKYCETCRIYRPPRCSHCRQCDNCVEDEDHHCIWLNNCIGRRNYRYFLIFVSTASIYAMYTSALCLTHLLLLYRDRKNDPSGVPSFQSDVLAKAPVSALVMVFAFIMSLAVGALAAYHFWLATVNRTTHEQWSASMMRPHVVDNPFDRGSIFGNCAAVLCRPPTRSYIRRRDYTVA
ncbi:Palmitoyltransferase zdhhc14 [Linnemannia schmuckeri]|uniref:Palmitoyltransferase n=1 Tax=Linnemannia schmuckeri TaxID=64567 RepID=A0A9P5S8I2_9FUNG|nr:Palmitoyltransferase zdhhc14 [Linnemannia schmuckeri]